MSPLKAYILKALRCRQHFRIPMTRLRHSATSRIEFKGVYALKVIDVLKKILISRRRQNSCYSPPWPRSSLHTVRADHRVIFRIENGTDWP